MTSEQDPFDQNLTEDDPAAIPSAQDAHDPRFRGVENLVGSAGLSALSESSVCIIGVGGVGSWAAEALARTGVGSLTLVDFDDICITNINRQIQALDSTVGHSKNETLAARLRDINPSVHVRSVEQFFTQKSLEEILATPYDVIIDAIDRMTNKCLLIATCRERGLLLITVGSAGERLDPTAIRVDDLARSDKDPLLAMVRKRLRQRHGFPRAARKKFGIPCVYAPLVGPAAKSIGVSCSGIEERTGWSRSCNEGLGSAAFMTGAFGFVAAAEAVKLLLRSKQA